MSVLPSIPLGNTLTDADGDVVLIDGKPIDSFTVGMGGNFTAAAEVFGFFAPYAEGAFIFNGQNRSDHVDAGLRLLSGGLGLSVFYYPIPRIATRIGAAGGLSYISLPAVGENPALAGTGIYWRAKAEVGYRFSPGFSLLASAGYSQYLGSDGVAFFKGLSTGITLNVGLSSLANRGDGILVETRQEAAAYPVTYLAYAKEPVGRFVLTNREQAEIRDVEVTFQAGSYTSGESVCARFPLIQRGASVEAPIVASFNQKVLSFTESTKVQGELLVRYRLLDSRIETKRAMALAFEHRNALTWADERLVASFISPNDPAILDLSKFVAGLVRERIRPEIDPNLQYAVGLFEALRLAGVAWAPDPSTPYKEYRGRPEKLDYLQYAYQTLAYKGGDSDDISVLYAELLESVGIPSAFLPLGDEMIAAVRLSASEAEARSAISSFEDLVFIEGQAWAPIQVSLAREGFLRAWQGGSKKWREASAEAKNRFIVVSEAWKTHPPIGLPDVDFRPPKPPEEQLNLAFDNAMGRFVTREVTPKARKMLDEMGPSGGTGKQRNSLGILYARYGLLPEAKAEFELAYAKGFVSALVNLGNVAYLQKDFETAVARFREALALLPQNKAALIGLARAQYELDAYAEADELFARVRAIDPALAERYAYLSSRVSGAASRAASAAADRAGAMSWADDN